MDDLDVKLCEWQNAGLLDEAAAERIRQHEASAGTKREGVRWQAVLAISFGAILLGAGIILFIAAHWEDISPLARFALVMTTTLLFHLGGAWARPRYAALATALHGVGTVSAFSGVALVGQIFQIQEHWPTGILLDMLCAAAGWWLIGDEIQQTLTLLALPAWIGSEWFYRAAPYAGQAVYLERMLAALGIVYLLGFAHSQRRVMRGILFAVGAVILTIAIPSLSSGWSPYAGYAFNFSNYHAHFVPLTLRLAAWTLIVLLAVLVALRMRSATIPFAGTVLVATWMPFALHIKVITERYYSYNETHLSLFAYFMTAALAMLVAWWGTQHASKIAINYGIIAFALTVAWFFFSDIFDKLDRSFGLMLMGIVFLAGGWILERLRRRLVRGIQPLEVTE